MRIYVRLPNWVGDVVLATPFFHALRRAYPGAEIVGHGKERLFSILEGAPLFDRTIGVERRLGPLWPFLEGRRVRKLVGDVDVAYLLPNTISAAIIARVLRAKERVGYGLNGRSLLLTHAIPVKKEGRLRPIPMIDYYLGLLATRNVPLGEVRKRPILPATPAARARIQTFLEKQGIAGERIWALNAGGAWETKRWPPENLARLIDKVAERGALPFVLHGPDEKDIVLAARSQAKATFFHEMVPLADLVAFLERCEILVSTDSGPRHFGVAANIPVITLIGSTHPGYTLVDHSPQKTLCLEVECWPCHLQRCPIDFRCMKQLTADMVASACDELLREKVS